jgi:YfiH family protein
MEKNASISNLLASVPGITHEFAAPSATPPSDLLCCHQVHSATVVIAGETPPAEQRKVKADGLFTTDRHPIGIQTADCLPVLIASRDGKAAAAVHAGWRGLHLGILLEAVKTFIQSGMQSTYDVRASYSASDLAIAIGPAIGPCCFEVSQETIDAFESSWGYLWKNSSKPYSNQQPKSSKLARSQAPISSNNLWLNLDLIARLQLKSLGVPDTNIEDVGYCTYCGPGSRASFRRATHEKTLNSSRQWSWIQLTSK